MDVKDSRALGYSPSRDAHSLSWRETCRYEERPGVLGLPRYLLKPRWPQRDAGAVREVVGIHGRVRSSACWPYAGVAIGVSDW